MDWSKYPNFSEKEFACSHCGECHMNESFIAKLQSLRSHYGKSMVISSGYHMTLNRLSGKAKSCLSILPPIAVRV